MWRKRQQEGDCTPNEKRRLESLLETVGQITYEHNIVSKEIYWTGLDSLGFDSQLTATPEQWWLDGIHPEDYPSVLEQLESARNGRTNRFRLEYRFSDATGAFHWFADRGIAHYSPEGDLLAVIGVFENIQRQKEHEAELVQARNNAETANRLKTNFLGIVSHEIRTPMNGVMGLSEVLLRTELSDEQRKLVTTIRESGASLLHLLDDLLDFAATEAGMLKLCPVHFSLPQLLEEVQSVLAPLAAARDVRLMLTGDVEE
ncbi:MAG: PAS domain-containing protein, partial [Bdellovibrionales bacterium]|nr:PAS domain-containing protein [Bdellovibrionales bacterium]